MNWQHAPQIEMQIRTRGPVRRHGSAPVTRTRGGIRTRGAVALETKPLAQLVGELRAKAHGSPSAVLIHGWDEALAQMFFGHMTAFLDGNDAVWLVPVKTAQSTEPPLAWPGAVVLDLSHEVDARTYANLVVDMVFFPTGKPAEVVEVRQWYGRAEAVIVGATAGQGPALLEGAPHNAPAIYGWSATKPEVFIGLLG